MAREYGKLWFTLFRDDHFCQQPLLDKLLYATLIAQPAVNYAGLAPVQLRRYMKAVAPATELEVKAALVRLERNRYVFTDSESEEVLIRTFIRNDEVHKQPNLLISALRSAAQVESAKLAAVLLDEIGKIELPSVKSEPLQTRLDKALAIAHAALSAKVEGLPEALPEPFAEDFPEPFPRPGETEPFPEGLPEALPEPSVVVAVAVDPLRTSEVKLGGRGRERTREGANPPPFKCSKHINDPDPPNCRACGDARQAHQAWQADQARADAEQRSTTARLRAQDRARAIADCPLCDNDGYRNRAVCDHTDRTHTAQAGIARVHAALAAARPTQETA